MHINSNESKNLNSLNSYNVIGSSNFTYSKVQHYSPFNTLVTLDKVKDAESSVSINYKITDENIMSEEILSCPNSAEIFDHTCDYNGINLINT